MKIIIAGDLSPTNRVSNLFSEGHYETVLSEVKNTIEAADYSIVNLETAIVGEIKPTPTVKWSPNLSSSPCVIDALKYAGFKCVTLANNHFRDYGNESVEFALNSLKEKGVDYVGGGLNLVDSQKILYKSICGIKVAFVNFCEHEMTTATEKNAGCAPLDLIENYRQISEAKRKAKFVIVIVHGGHEHYQLPSPRMQKTYRWFTEIGADVVVNHHQHCYSGYELYNGNPIFYGLGNFCFDSNNSNYSLWNEGLLLQLDITDELSFQLIPYEQCFHEPHVKLLENERKQKVLDTISNLNDIISNEDKVLENHIIYCRSRYDDMRMCMAPYTNRVLFSLALRRIIPSFDNKKRALRAIDYIECESHNDVFINYLYNIVNE